MTLRCLLSHRTALVYGQTFGFIGCMRCGDVLESWSLIRPEEQHRADRAHAALVRERDARAAAMSTPTVTPKGRLVRWR